MNTLLRQLAEDEAADKKVEQAVQKALTQALAKAASEGPLDLAAIVKGLAQLKGKVESLSRAATLSEADPVPAQKSAVAGQWKQKVAALAKMALDKAKDPHTVASALISTGSVILGNQAKLTDLMGEAGYKALLDSIAITVEILVRQVKVTAKGVAAKVKGKLGTKQAAAPAAPTAQQGQGGIADSLDAMIANLIEARSSRGEWEIDIADWDPSEEAEAQGWEQKGEERGYHSFKGMAAEDLMARELEDRVQAKENMAGQNFAGLDLRGASLQGGQFGGANFARADLSGSDGGEGDFHDADFSGANLSGMDFTGANLQNARFNGADLRGANFTSANLRDAELRDADTTDAEWRMADVRGTEMGDNPADEEPDEPEDDEDEVFSAAPRFGLSPRDAAHLASQRAANESVRERGLRFTSFEGPASRVNVVRAPAIKGLGKRLEAWFEDRSEVNADELYSVFRAPDGVNMDEWDEALKRALSGLVSKGAISVNDTGEWFVTPKSEDYCRFRRVESFGGALHGLLTERIRTYQVQAANQRPTRRQGPVVFVFDDREDAEDAAIAASVSPDLGREPDIFQHGDKWAFEVPYPVAGTLDLILRRNSFQRRL